MNKIYFHIISVYQPNGGVPHDNLVMIRMKPDENGRFGFNVKVRVHLMSFMSVNIIF